jgi:hypothetical protein
VAFPGGLDAYRGPGRLLHFPDNDGHDPIIYDYGRVHPWSSCVMNAEGTWTEYRTPREITGRIRDVYVAYRPVGGAEGTFQIDRVLPIRVAADPDATDTLLAFEGGTGDKGEPGQPASQSLMGFVLLRTTGATGYDAHIAFRGSRSGKAMRAFFEALSTGDASGNPDWITDLGWAQIDASSGGGHVTTIGAVARGFATCTASMLPTVFACLQKAAELRGSAPRNIYVTGHSLGGALAQHFTSAVLLGNLYGPDAAGPAMPAELRSWPWTRLKLITFGAPRAGDAAWAEYLTVQGLDSEFFDAGLYPYDDAALESTAPEIAPRLLNAERAAAYRVLISTDPITSDVLAGGEHVGKTVYANQRCGSSPVGIPDVDSHEPEEIRELILEATADTRTPPVAWRYLDMRELNPTRDEDERGSPEEFRKLKDAILSYYADRGLTFDADAFIADFDLMLSLE